MNHSGDRVVRLGNVHLNNFIMNSTPIFRERISHFLPLFLCICLYHGLQAQATISYAQTNYCQQDADPTPTITGTTGGSFSAAAGLVLNGTTGTIDVSASTPGSYTITYTFSTGTTTASITVLAIDDAGFTYGRTIFCTNDTANPVPIVTGQAGGTFVSAPFGLVVNPTTGEVDVSASNLGTYTIRYTTPAPCSNFRTINVTLEAPPRYVFFYPRDTFCTNGPNFPQPVLNPSFFGTFTSDPPSGALVSGFSGALDLPNAIPGTYTITYTSSPNNSNCLARVSDVITIVQSDNPAFNYGALRFCANEPDVTPIVINTNGGTFSAASGLALNPVTGTIDLSASTPGSYIITYVTAGRCPDQLSQRLDIDPIPDASFSYSALNYCKDNNDPTPTITGIPGGQFSSLSAGLSLNASTGEIDLSASATGTYQVVYTVTASCIDSDTTTVIINNRDNGAFSYPSTQFCQDAPTPVPTLVGAASGTFSSTSGLALNSTTGVVDLIASAEGFYAVTYITNGVCPDTNRVFLLVDSVDDASFTYPSSTVCQRLGTIAAATSGTSGGLFTSASGLVLNGATGSIDALASVPATYTVQYATSGRCADTSTQSITILPLEDASFSYSKTVYCENEPNAVPNVLTAGGQFSTATAGLALNASTGSIDIGNSTPRTYVVTHVTTGSCPDTVTQSLSIVGVGSALFAYGQTTYCVGDPDPLPSVLITTGGRFSSNGLLVDSLSGQLDLGAAAGTFAVTHIIDNGSCADTNVVSVVVTGADSASFAFADTIICIGSASANFTLSAASNATGSYSATPAGLVFANATTGEIDAQNSSIGIYALSYTTNGPCPDTVAVRLELTTCLQTNQLEEATTTYQLYPNPNKGQFYLHHQGETEQVSIRIIDALGRSIYEEPSVFLNEGAYPLNLEAVQPGVYWLVVESRTRRWQTTFAIE